MLTNRHFSASLHYKRSKGKTNLAKIAAPFGTKIIFPPLPLSVLVKYNNISVEQTALMVPANKPQILYPFTFVFLFALLSPCQLDRALISQKHLCMLGKKWKTLNLT